MNDKKRTIDHLNERHQARKRKLLTDIYARNEPDLSNMEPLTDEEVAQIEATFRDDPPPLVDPDIEATQLANFLDYVRAGTDARRNRDIAENILGENDS